MDIVAMMLLGTLAGLVTGVTAMGAGALIAPALLLAGADPADAVGITLLTSLAIRVVASLFFRPLRPDPPVTIDELAGAVQGWALERRLTVLLVMGGLVGASVGTLPAAWADAKAVRTPFVGIVLLLVAMGETVRARSISSRRDILTVRWPAVAVLTAALGAALTAVSGTGVGTVTGAGMMAAYRRLPLAPLIRANIVAAMFTLTWLVLVHVLTHPDVDMRAGLPVVLTGAVGAAVGGMTQRRLPVEALRRAVVVVMTLAGLWMVIH